MNWTEGEENRNGSSFESREKALNRKSYDLLFAQTTLKSDSSFATEKGKKGSRRRLRDLAREGSEKNDTRLLL